MSTSFPFDNIRSPRIGANLSEQLADALARSIREGKLQAGHRLPTESAMTERFGVSRAVVREALSRLKTLDLVESRQGFGAFVKGSSDPALGRLVLKPDGSLNAVMQMVEVRRALEAESASLAAERRTRQGLREIKATVRQLEEAVANGGDGVAEDVAFHAAIASAARNPFLLATLAYLNHFLIDATRVTRANEATRADFAQQVRDEHAAVVNAIEAGDADAARIAGAAHMINAAYRIRHADPAFWVLKGRDLAERLRTELRR